MADDTIDLASAVFLGIFGGLAADQFHIGASAADANDFIVYDSVTGKLYYDNDGNGAKALVQFARLDTGLALTNTDFHMV